MHSSGGRPGKAIVDGRCWRAAEVAAELAQQGWAVERCEGALRSVSVPKASIALLIDQIGPPRADGEDTMAALRASGAAHVRLRESSNVVIRLVAPTDGHVLSPADLAAASAATAGTAIAISTISDLCDALYAALAAGIETAPQAKAPRPRMLLREALCWMTWRSTGLPEDAIDSLLSAYPSVEDLLRAAASLRCTPPLCGGAGPAALTPLEEVATFLSNDYYVE